jgi:hypothetical protein
MAAIISLQALSMCTSYHIGIAPLSLNTETMAAFATLLVPTPMVLLYIDSVMITYTRELH